MNRSWNVLCWNVRGINSESKWDALRDKTEESACSVFCLQETKCDNFDTQYIHNFAPKRFDKFDYILSLGASSGILVVWVSSIFCGTTIEKQCFALTISFQSQHNGSQWYMYSVYGPCTKPARSDFLAWFKDLNI